MLDVVKSVDGDVGHHSHLVNEAVKSGHGGPSNINVREKKGRDCSSEIF